MATRRGRILLAAGVTAAALAAAETFFRVRLVVAHGATDFEAIRDRLIGRDLRIFHRDADGELELVPSRFQGSQVHVNAQGFRGAALREPKPERGFRVACIGGSGCFGTTSTGDATTFPAALERRLRAQACDPEAVEVVNAGLPGATTASAISRFEKLVPPHRPDVVLLYNLINDLLTSRRAQLGLDERRTPLVRIDGALSGLLSHSAIWLTFRATAAQAEKVERIRAATAREAARKTARADGHAGPRAGDPALVAHRLAIDGEARHVYDGTPATNLYLVAEHHAEFREHLRRFDRAVRACGAVPLFCTFALRFDGTEDEETYRREGPVTAYAMPSWRMAFDAVAAFNETIREVARETGSPLADVDRDLGREAAYFAPKDTDHFTDEGCEAVAVVLARALSREGLLRGAATPR